MITSFDPIWVISGLVWIFLTFVWLVLSTKSYKHIPIYVRDLTEREGDSFWWAFNLTKNALNAHYSNEKWINTLIDMDRSLIILNIGDTKYQITNFKKLRKKKAHLLEWSQTLPADTLIFKLKLKKIKKFNP